MGFFLAQMTAWLWVLWVAWRGSKRNLLTLHAHVYFTKYFTKHMYFTLKCLHNCTLSQCRRSYLLCHKDFGFIDLKIHQFANKIKIHEQLTRLGGLLRIYQ